MLTRTARPAVLLRTACLLLLAVPLVGATECGGSEEACDVGNDADCAPAPAPNHLTYHYVMILDRTAGSGNGGVDIDAVALIQGGMTYYADNWYEYVAGPDIYDVTTQNDANAALGPPNNQVGDCIPATDTFYVDLGATGGSLIVSFASLHEIRAGDAIRIYECGSATASEMYDVLVGTGTTVSDPNWVACASNAVGVSECTVPTLPEIPVP